MAATPILDLEQLPPAAPNRWWPILWGVVIGLVVAAIPILADQGMLPDWNWPAFNGLLLLPALLLGIAVHEIAHAVVGRLAGLEFGGISIGPMVLLKSGSTWAFRLHWRSFAGGFFKPLAGRSEAKAFPYVWMVAAGPFASFLSAGFCWLVIKQYGNGFWNFTGTLFWTSLFLGFASGIPYSYGLQQSDGARVWRLLLHPEQFLQLTLMLTVQTEEASGVRPRDWSSLLCNQMAAVESSAPEYLGCQLLIFYRLLDLGDEWAALPHLENALSKSGKAGKALRPTLFLEAASACARIKNEPGKARVWRERALALLRRPTDAFRTADASIAMAEGRYDEAAGLWRSARELMLKRRLNSGLAHFALDKWSVFEDACREIAGAPVEATRESGS